VSQTTVQVRLQILKASISDVAGIETLSTHYFNVAHRSERINYMRTPLNHASCPPRLNKRGRFPISTSISHKHQGLLLDSGPKGLEVHLSTPSARDLHQVRAALDGLAARIAARVSMAKRVQADIAFHRAIYKICGDQPRSSTGIS
jgi:hypothetical protein